ncbi:MAG: class I SAM-dependent methyltransferase [Spirochaetes bacterium]|nr:class I SAM-dependent methyltransferase [Spirochaetota bacterium]
MTSDSDEIKISESQCPLCLSKENQEIYDNHISLFKCRECGIIFNEKHCRLDYDDSYFTSKYREQYGKTYLEDYENIYAVSICRLNRILKIKKDTDGSRLLEIGSAMGFFLKAAMDSGIKDVLGIEISGYAAKYCVDKFHINVINFPFNDVKLNGMFDIIAAWYFLEHVFDPSSTVKTIFNSLNSGGIFAFSAPSFFGPQYFFKRNEWFESHPADHRIDFSPKSAENFLKKIGFQKIYIFPGGIHPERVIGKNSLFFKLFKYFYAGISRMVSFSDTMEVYAVK